MKLCNTLRSFTALSLPLHLKNRKSIEIAEPIPCDERGGPSDAALNGSGDLGSPNGRLWQHFEKQREGQHRYGVNCEQVRRYKNENKAELRECKSKERQKLTECTRSTGGTAYPGVFSPSKKSHPSEFIGALHDDTAHGDVSM